MKIFRAINASNHVQSLVKGTLLPLLVISLSHCGSGGSSASSNDSEVQAADTCKGETGAPATPNDGQNNWVFNPPAGSQDAKDWNNLNQAISNSNRSPCTQRLMRAVGSQESGGNVANVQKDQLTNGKKGTISEEIGPYRQNVGELQSQGVPPATINEIRGGNMPAATNAFGDTIDSPKYPDASSVLLHHSGGPNPTSPLDQQYPPIILGHVTAQDQCIQQTGQPCRTNTKQEPH